MSPLARLLVHFGCSVVGADKNLLSPEIKNLEKIGIKVYNEREIELEGIDALVYSLAVGEDSPAILKARSMEIPMMSRAQCLGAVVEFYKESVAVSGSHGKSTVTAMLGAIFKEAGKSPTVLCGAGVDGTDGLTVGEGDLVIYESCEYKDSILYLPPRVQLITSVELDHTDYFPDFEAIRRTFGRAIENASDAVILNIDDPYLKLCAKNCDKTVITYGTDTEAIYSYTLCDMDADGSEFFIGKEKFRLGTTGEYNVKNALAAYACARYFGIGVETIKTALLNFHGVENRMQRLSDYHSRPLYLDYAHHPTEIKAAVSTLKRLYGKCTVIFKPHTYSRTAALFDGFLESLSLADRVILLDVYAARETDLYGINLNDMAKKIGHGCLYLEREEKIKEEIDKTLGAIVIMGAGGLLNIRKILEKE